MSDYTSNHHQMDILIIDINNVNLDNNFDEDDPDTIILIKFLVWHIKVKKRKALEKNISEELMPVAWHPKRCLSFCTAEDRNARKRK